MTPGRTAASLLMLFVAGSLSASAAAQNRGRPPAIGSLDVDSRETGDGAGCLFSVDEGNAKTYVLVDRDGYGWMRLDGTVEKLVPVPGLVMWPSKEGETLTRTYTSGDRRAELKIEVVTGCAEREDNCAVSYGGTLRLATTEGETLLRVEGRCVD